MSPHQRPSARSYQDGEYDGKVKSTDQAGTEILTFALRTRKDGKVDSEYTMYRHDHHMGPVDR